ncbi:MAG: NAD(P)-dependent oxidoreductase [Candidatus Binataceae bacterium]|jgi:3-hydroxyisobutyrate dehydrogenase-like beta-hydroxyacid dehydrogenase
MTNEAGFIGLGSMGLPIASNLITAGTKLRVYNRTASKAAPLTAQGALQAASVGDTAVPGGIVFTMLADDAAVTSVVHGDDGLAARLAPGGIHVSISTIAPATARELARYHAERGSIYLASPVFGRPENAARKQLVVCVAGPAAAKERVRPFQEAIGRAIFDFGDEPGAANIVKLAGNFMIGAAIEAMAEAFTMVEKSGADRMKAAAMLTQTLFACPVYQNYGEMVAAKRHLPAGFKLSLGLKDFELALKTSGEVRVPMPIASLVRDRFIAGIAHGREAMDWSALALGVLDDAGIK